jgi:hypothetical protein
LVRVGSQHLTQLRNVRLYLSLDLADLSITLSWLVSGCSSAGTLDRNDLSEHGGLVCCPLHDELWIADDIKS